MEATSTLADTLLDDLDDLDDVVEEEEEEQPPEEEEAANAGFNRKNIDTGSALDHPATSNLPKVLQKPRFLDNTSLHNHLERIAHTDGTTSGTYDDDDRKPAATTKLSDQEEYEMIVQSNQFLAQLSDELIKVHATLTQVYGPKFPELQDLLPGIMVYKTAVQVIQNTQDLTTVNDALNAQSCFHANQIITMTVAASTTAGRQLTDEELRLALQLASYMDEIAAVQSTFLSFVERHIANLAPSTCALIGPQVTAKLLGLAGGLSELAQIPACNLQVLGHVKAKDRAGLSSKHAGPGNAQQQPHQGVLVECDLLTSNVMAPSVRQKLFKQVAAKVALAARCDAVNVQQGRPRTSAPGEKFRQDLMKKYRQWQEPHQASVQKALPNLISQIEQCIALAAFAAFLSNSFTMSGQ